MHPEWEGWGGNKLKDGSNREGEWETVEQITAVGNTIWLTVFSALLKVSCGGTRAAGLKRPSNRDKIVMWDYTNSAVCCLLLVISTQSPVLLYYTSDNFIRLMHSEARKEKKKRFRLILLNISSRWSWSGIIRFWKWMGGSILSHQDFSEFKTFNLAELYSLAQMFSGRLSSCQCSIFTCCLVVTQINLKNAGGLCKL